MTGRFFEFESTPTTIELEQLRHTTSSWVKNNVAKQHHQLNSLEISTLAADVEFRENQIETQQHRKKQSLWVGKCYIWWCGSFAKISCRAQFKLNGVIRALCSFVPHLMFERHLRFTAFVGTLAARSKPPRFLPIFCFTKLFIKYGNAWMESIIPWRCRCTGACGVYWRPIENVLLY